MRDRGRSNRGAAAIEMALVMPMLILLILGIIEFGYLFGEYNEIRHGAREGARIAAVSNADFDQDGDADFDAEDIRIYVCDTLSLTGGASATITLTQTGTGVGDEATVSVDMNTASLSGAPVVSSLIPDSLGSTATFRLEVPASWSVPGTPGTC